MSAITLLDGSLGQELVKRSGDAPTALWSTQVMMDRPELVRAVHDDYLAAGATIVTTNTYAVHVSRLERVGLEAKQMELLDIAVAQAVAARDAFGGGQVLGSMGPLYASYRPDLQPDVAVAAKLFGAIAKHIAPHVDLFAHETVTSVLEAQGALTGTDDLGKPVWLALSTDDHDGTKLRSGEPLADIAPVLKNHRVDAVLINCTRPESVDTGLPIISKWGLPFGAYANGFTHISDGFKTDAPTVDALEARAEMTPQAYADHAMSWIDQGATIIGGCCEIGPDHIKEIANRIEAAGHTIV